MGLTLDIGKTIQLVKEAPEVPEGEVFVDLDVELDTFLKFCRILEATSAEDIADISTEEVIHLFENFDQLTPYFQEKENVVCNAYRYFSGMHSVIRQRRIL